MSIRKLRELRGMTGSEAARRIGVTRRCLGYWESGRSYPSSRFIEPIARTYGVSESEALKFIYGGNEDECVGELLDVSTGHHGGA